MKLEKKDAVLYIRVRPSIKKWLIKRAKKEGWENLSAYMDAWFDAVRSRDSRKRPAK